MKPFNEAAAKAGAPVCTRDGRDARVICFDMRGEYPIVAIVNRGSSEVAITYTSEGKYLNFGDEEKPQDLFMRPTKREGWVNVYRDLGVDGVYTTERDAVMDVGTGLVATVKIEWEE